jgi:hypothetical protein
MPELVSGLAVTLALTLPTPPGAVQTVGPPPPISRPLAARGLHIQAQPITARPRAEKSPVVH